MLIFRFPAAAPSSIVARCAMHVASTYSTVKEKNERNMVSEIAYCTLYSSLFNGFAIAVLFVHTSFIYIVSEF